MVASVRISRTSGEGTQMPLSWRTGRTSSATKGCTGSEISRGLSSSKTSATVRFVSSGQGRW